MAMNPLLIGPLLEIGKTLINRFFPDPAQAAAAQFELLKMAQTGELAQLASDTELAKAQLLVNQVEAGSSNFWVAGWRPAVGWVSVAGLGYTYMLQPLLPWIATVAGLDVPPLPSLDTNVLMTLLFGILGIGAYRSVEKIKGVA